MIPPEFRPVFVLVHGGWHGGWCYGRTTRALWARGFEAHAPTLTGLGDRAHLLNRAIDLDCHIEDVVRFIEAEDLRRVVLCGPSYGGVVISGVAERVRERLAGLSFIDALVPEDGQSLIDALPEGRGQRFRDSAARAGFGWLIPPVPAAYFNVNEPDRDWVDRLCVPHPLRCFEQPVRLAGARESLPRQYILAADFGNGGFGPVAERLRTTPGWRVDALPGGHDLMVDNPQGLAEALLAHALPTAAGVAPGGPGA